MWMPQLHQESWSILGQPLWGAELRRDVGDAHTQPHAAIEVWSISVCSPATLLGNHKADALAKEEAVLEGVQTPYMWQSGFTENQDTGPKTTWETAKMSYLPIKHSDWQAVDKRLPPVKPVATTPETYSRSHRMSH